MKPADFVASFYKDAQASGEKTGVPWVVTLAQGALESGWGAVAPGNMFFGVKDSDGINGNEQLLVTTEYSRFANLKFPEIISVTPVVRNGLPYFKYKIRDYFRKYDTPEQSFTDHANFFVRNKRYAKAMAAKDDYKQFIIEIAKAGYATDPNYARDLTSIANKILQLKPPL